MLKGKRILITGGTGSLGRALTERILQEDVESVRIFSRNENKQIQMRDDLNEFRDKLRFFIGDIREYSRLLKAMEGVDVIFHAAALKHIDVVEYNPFEGVKTNIIGTQNVVDVCHELKTEYAIAVSTDKAVSPLNIYGATKLLTEKLFVSASNYVDIKKHPTKFTVVRYGNVLGSSGSVVPKFMDLIRDKKPIMITDPKMTRFSIKMEDALDFILNSMKESKGADTFVPQLKAYNIMDLKDAMFELLGETEIKMDEVRPNEKINEILINSEEMKYTLMNKMNFVVVAPSNIKQAAKLYPTYQKAQLDGDYSSKNAMKLTKDEIKEMIRTLIPKENN